MLEFRFVEVKLARLSTNTSTPSERCVDLPVEQLKRAEANLAFPQSSTPSSATSSSFPHCGPLAPRRPRSSIARLIAKASIARHLLPHHSSASMMPSSPFSPIASTSRIPYSPPTLLPTRTTPPSHRPFSSSTPRPARRATAHIIHPLLRQRLTNLTFAFAGLLSVATVSLTMSGTLGNGAAPGCPARSRVGVAAEEEKRRKKGEEADGEWWKKGQFLEDPVVPSAPVRPASLVRAAKEQAVEDELRRAASQEGRIEERVQEQPAVVIGSRSRWGAAMERVV